MSRSLLPPLNALRAFEATARLGEAKPPPLKPGKGSKSPD